MKNNSTSLSIIIGIVALIIGAIGGYYYGSNKATISGQASDQQTQAVIEAEKARLAELQKAANPFKNSYQNPFAQ